MRRIQLRPAKYSCGVCPPLRAAHWLDYYLGPFGFVPDVVNNVRREQAHEWPPWCYAPLGVFQYALRVFETMCERIGEPGRFDQEAVAQTLGQLAALVTWRASQGVYRFHADVARAVMSTSLAAIPTDVLFRMPDWCPYVEFPEPQSVLDLAPGNEIRIHGFFAYLDSQSEVSSVPILRLALDAENLSVAAEESESLLCVPVVLEPGASFDEACKLGAVLHAKIARHLLETDDSAGPLDPITRTRLEVVASVESGQHPELPAGMRQVMRSALCLLLYLCADQAEIPGRVEPLPTRFTVRAPRAIPTRPTVYPCGMRLGAAIEHARRVRDENVIGNPTGRTQAAHIRSAHWHTFWTGPRDGERVAVVRWLPPIAVNLDDDAPTAASIHPVPTAQKER